MRSNVGGIRSRVGSTRGAVGTGTSAPTPVYGSGYTTSLMPGGGQAGSTATYLITPVSGGFNGNPIALTLSGFTAGTVPSPTPGSMTPISVPLLVTGGAGTNAIVNSTISGMTNSTGVDTFAVAQPVVVTPPPTPSANATRFDLIMDQSVVAPGATATGGLYPQSGNWSGSGKTATITLSNGAAVTVNLPSSGNAKVLVSFTAPGTPGHQALAVTNTAGLRNPTPAPLSVFAATSGGPAGLSLGAMPGTYVNQRVFQQHVWSGAPNGWSGTNGCTLRNGWGRVVFSVNASNAQGLFARLTDADTGTIITNVAQVYGLFTGAVNAALILPASDYCVFLDLDTSVAFNSPVRVPFKFFVRDNILVITRSAENMLWGSFANGIPGNTNWSSYQKTTGLGSQNTSNAGYESDSGGWGRADGTYTFGNSGQSYGGVGGQELGREFVAFKGTGVGILGLVPAGGDMDTFWAEDGTPCNSAIALAAAADNEFRYMIYESAGWTGVYAPQSLAEYQKVHTALCTTMFARYPSLAIISGNADSGQYGSNGSSLASSNIGFARQNRCVHNVELVDPCVVASDASEDWNEYYTNSGHAAWASAIRYARARARSLILAESVVAGGYGRGAADRHTTLATTGTLANNIITIPFHLAPGATRVNLLHWQNHLANAAAWVYTAANSTEGCALVALYQGAGVSYGGSSDTLIIPMSVTTDGSNLLIGVPAGTTGPITVQFLADFYRTVSEDQSFWCGFFDDRDLGDSCGYGPGVRQQLDVVAN